MLKKLELKTFKKAGRRDLLKYLCINLAISSCANCCIFCRLCCLKTLLFFCFLASIKLIPFVETFATFES